MKKYWLHWTRPQFAVRVFPVVILVVVLDHYLVPRVSSASTRLGLSLVSTILMVLAIYVTFTWIAAQDRRRRE